MPDHVYDFIVFHSSLFIDTEDFIIPVQLLISVKLEVNGMYSQRGTGLSGTQHKTKTSKLRLETN